MLGYIPGMATPQDSASRYPVDVKRFFERVEALGEEQGLSSLRAISLESGLAHSTLWKAKERGNLPSLSSMKKVANRLGATTDQLLESGDGHGQDDIEALAVSLRVMVAHAASNHRKNPELGHIEELPTDSVPALYGDYARLILTTIDKAREGWTREQILPLLEGALRHGLRAGQAPEQGQALGGPEGSILLLPTE